MARFYHILAPKLNLAPGQKPQVVPIPRHHFSQLACQLNVRRPRHSQVPGMPYLAAAVATMHMVLLVADIRWKSGLGRCKSRRGTWRDAIDARRLR